jgi:dTMP kinase
MTTKAKGKFITIEGPDGAGKTSQVKLLVQLLQDQGLEAIQTREPGGTPLGEQIRGLILNEKMCLKTEMLLFAAARAQHVEQVIKPALERGAVVVCDRFSDSTYAYQGHGRGDIARAIAIEAFTLDGFEPDHTLFFDVTLPESMRRLTIRANDINTFDMEEARFKIAVYNGYQKRFKDNPHRMHRIDAMLSLGEVTVQVVDWVMNVLLPQMRAEQDFVDNQVTLKVQLPA